jgi:hypothetical protein
MPAPIAIDSKCRLPYPFLVAHIRGKVPKKANRHAKWLWFIGHLASWLCLVHCLATVVLTFVAPSLLRLMPHNFFVELGAWSFVLISSLFLLSRAPKRQWHLIIFAILFAAGTTSLILHNHNHFAYCFMGLALFQLYLTLSHHMMEHTSDDECCQHPEHHHHHPHAHEESSS